MLCLLFSYILIFSTVLILINKKVIKNNYTFVFIIITTIILFIIYSSFNPKNVLLLCNEDLNKRYLTNPQIKGWSISHFLLYSVIGFIVPDFYWILILGVVWEVFEYIMGVVFNKKKYWTSGGISGQMTDLIMNVLGFIVGGYLRNNVIKI